MNRLPLALQFLLLLLLLGSPRKGHQRCRSAPTVFDASSLPRLCPRSSHSPLSLNSHLSILPPPSSRLCSAKTRVQSFAHIPWLVRRSISFTKGPVVQQGRLPNTSDYRLGPSSGATRQEWVVRAWQTSFSGYNPPIRSIVPHRDCSLFLSSPFATVASIIGTMSKVVRSVKNVTKGYSSVQVKVRNGTCGLWFGLDLRANFAIAAPPLLLASVVQGLRPPGLGRDAN